MCRVVAAADVPRGRGGRSRIAERSPPAYLAVGALKNFHGEEFQHGGPLLSALRNALAPSVSGAGIDRRPLSGACARPLSVLYGLVRFATGDSDRLAARAAGRSSQSA
jgi:hypothetical protein